MVNFSLSALDVTKAMAAIPNITLQDLKVSALDGVVTATMDWYCHSDCSNMNGFQTDGIYDGGSDASSATGAGGASAEAKAKRAWRNLFEISCRSDYPDATISSDDIDVSGVDTMLNFHTHKENWIFGNGGKSDDNDCTGVQWSSPGNSGQAQATALKPTLLESKVGGPDMNDVLSSNSRAQIGLADTIERGIGMDFLRSLANNMTGISATGVTDASSNAALGKYIGNLERLSNVEDLMNDLLYMENRDQSNNSWTNRSAEKLDSSGSVAQQFAAAQTSALQASADASGDHTNAANLCARIYDQLVSFGEGRDRVAGLLNSRNAKADKIQPFKDGDTLSFTVEINPQSTGTVDVTNANDASGSQGSSDSATAESGTTGNVTSGDNVSVKAGHGATPAAPTLSAVKYNVVITLKTATEATEQEG